MKKLFILLAILGFTMVSCKSIEDKTKNCLEELYEHAAADDIESFKECYQEYSEWYEDLSYEDQEEADWIAEKWSEKNALKAYTIGLYTMANVDWDSLDEEDWMNILM